MPITKGYRQLVDEAMAEVTTYSVAQARDKLADPATQIVDIRDIRELSDGTVEGAVHAPRGMLEFWVDPASPYFKPLFGDASREFILFCGLGWRRMRAWVRSAARWQRLAHTRTRLPRHRDRLLPHLLRLRPLLRFQPLRQRLQRAHLLLAARRRVLAAAAAAALVAPWWPAMRCRVSGCRA